MPRNAKHCATLILMVLALGRLAAVDVVEMKHGNVLRGTVIQRTDAAITLQMQYGVVTLRADQVKSISQEADPEPAPATAAAQDRLPAWSGIVAKLARLPWADGLRQVPATVIDVGVMRNVPYMSFRCGGGDYEVNVYGDPDAPACIEVGTYNRLRTDAAARANAISLLRDHVLANPLDRLIIGGLGLEGDIATHGKLTIESTPHTAPDAYGGWWMAVYFADAVEALRAKAEEVAAISVETTQPASATSDETSWTSADMSSARAAPVRRSSGSGSSSGSSGGRVYVRGYYRKNGTYVSGHSRRK